VQLPLISLEEHKDLKGFLVGLLIVLPTAVAAFGARWLVDNVPSATALLLAVMGLLLIVLSTCVLAFLPSPPPRWGLLLLAGGFFGKWFSLIIAYSYRAWIHIAVFALISLSTVLIGAYLRDRRRTSANDEDGGAGG
jgi:hypothetical protein